MNRREIPGPAKLKLHESTFYKSGPETLVKYQAKPSKTVQVVLSTHHAGAVCQSDGKKKPESVLYYNTVA